MSRDQVADCAGMKSSATKDSFAHWPFAVFGVLYAALLFAHINHGLASLDGHGIVHATRQLIENHRIEISRPPGHPTTEIYLFPAIGSLLELAGYKFNEKIYLTFQAIAAVATLVLFYDLIRRIGATSWRALLAAVCLAFSVQYFSNAIDGEEFIFGIFFILLAIRFLIVTVDGVVRFSRLLLSILCFALATGCRPELIFAGAIFPIYCLLHPKLGWKDGFTASAIAAVAVLIVWLPIFFAGLKAPYDVKLNLRELTLSGGYKLAFQCFTVPVFVVLCVVLAGALARLQIRIRDPFPENFIFASAVAISIIFFVLLFRYPTKPAFTLVAVPFLVMLAVKQSPALLVSLTLATLLGFFVNLDIFRGRQLVHPFPISGGYFQAIRAKPFYKRDYLRQLVRQCEGGPSVVIGDAWPWDFEYQIARDNFSAEEKLLSNSAGKDFPAFYPGENDACILLPRDGALQTQRLKNWQHEGRTLKMDAAVYRTFFARYDTGPLTMDRVRANDLSFSLFAIDSTNGK